MGQVTIIHERFNVLGGAEKVTLELAKLWPDSHVYSVLADPTIFNSHIEPHRTSTSWLQRVGSLSQRDDRLLPLIPLALASSRFADSDLVVASHYAFANRIRVPDHVRSISYVHSPARWMWDSEMREVEYSSRWARQGLAALAMTQRRADRRAAARMNGLIANSTTVAERIESHWNLTARIVHPPVDIDFFTPDQSVERDDYFLIAGRCVPYKRTQVAIHAANATGSRLIVAGDGRSLDHCRAIAGPTIEFVGAVDDARLRDLYRSAKALVFPGVEDFGIVPVEAQACGTPVIGVDLGGLRDTVIAGTTGELIPHRHDPNEQAELLAAVMGSFEANEYRSAKIRTHAMGFGADTFASGIRRAAESIG